MKTTVSYNMRWCMIKMDAVGSSEVVNIYQTTQSNVPEDSNLQRIIIII
jgi:hypothetical protein